MEKNRYLNIKGANLEKEQLNKYITQIAEEHIISKHSDKDTYPIGKLKENFEIILDTVKNIEKNIKLKQYIKLPGIANRKISRICTNICISK